MSMVLVWVLVTMPSNGVVSYSPPLVDLTDCQALKKQVNTPQSAWSQCVQIKTVMK